MNWPALVLGLIFLAPGVAFARAARSPDAAIARNKRLASIFMFVAAAAFFAAFAFSAYRSEAA